eukprot:CAMPEP_0181337362 /NCGR_PEP_ID=MMETSP1101-20121128/27970_1 /TAXON_ID=46948 /ORGANISM="Rhodomonas abbreviata, Strain Caron Lab Isolate" /LENGTH=84 /DNA_ID=CAMNT_0023447835 /DNA_START=92 /DNA_END=343 /DNA_ORIENTATION=-
MKPLLQLKVTYITTVFGMPEFADFSATPGLPLPPSPHATVISAGGETSTPHAHVANNAESSASINSQQSVQLLTKFGIKEGKCH